MLLLGLFLIALGGLAIVAAVFTAELNDGKIEYLGQDLSALALFLVGVGAGVAVLLGFSIFKWGTKRGWARRKEQKKMEDLSEKLGRVQDRDHDIDEHADEDRPTL
jgi:uncharacterized protein (DUF2062 family)